MELLRLALIGGLVGLDTTAALQMMVSQPLVGGLLAGWALHDPWQGAFIGLLFQGLYLAEFPVGGRIFPDGNLAAVQAAALAIYSQTQLHLELGLSLLLAFFWAWLMAMAGGQVIVWTRRLHAYYLPLLDQLVAADRRAALNLLYFGVIFENFLVSAVWTAAAFFIGLHLFQLIAPAISEVALIESWGLALRGGLLGASCGVIFFILTRNTKRKKGEGLQAVGRRL